MSTKIPFGEWLPDQPVFGLQGATVATNVVPEQQSYVPFPIFSVVTNALGGRAQGAIVAISQANLDYMYVGNASALYTLVGSVSFSVATRLAGGAYTTAANEYWEFAQWRDIIIGVNGLVDLPQQISLGAANFTDLSIGVKAKHITTMKDFLVLGNVSDSSANAYRVRWSAINNYTSFTVDAATLADFQDLPSEGGPIQRVMGGEYGVIFQSRSIWRMQFVGAPLIFQFDRIHSGIGAYAAQACVRYQNLIFFIAEDGFYSFNGTELAPIGRGKVDNFFFNDLDEANAHRINAAIDAPRKLVMWAYPSNSGGGVCDKIIVYSWAFNRWTIVEGLSLEYFMLSTGLLIVISGFDSTHTFGKFNGSAMAATIDTGEFQLFEDRRALITEVRPVVIGLSASATITVLNRNNLTESVSVGAVATSPNGTGFCQARVGARYFRIRMQTSSTVNFTHIIGIEVVATPEGVR